MHYIAQYTYKVQILHITKLYLQQLCTLEALLVKTINSNLTKYKILTLWGILQIYNKMVKEGRYFFQEANCKFLIAILNQIKQSLEQLFFMT
jgi:hypothetical protein